MAVHGQHLGGWGRGITNSGSKRKKNDLAVLALSFKHLEIDGFTEANSAAVAKAGDTSPTVFCQDRNGSPVLYKVGDSFCSQFWRLGNQSQHCSVVAGVPQMSEYR